MPKTVLNHQRSRVRRNHTLWIIGGSIVAVVVVGSLLFLNTNL